MKQIDRIVTKLALTTLAVLLAQSLTVSLRAADTPAASAKAVELKLDSDTAVVLDASRNGFPAKTKLLATEPYDSYLLAPVVDGIKQRQDLSALDAAWASAEDGTTHGIEIQLSQPQRGGRFQVTWAYDTNGPEGVRWWVSREFVIQVKDKAGDEWKTVVEVKHNQSVVGCYPLPESAFSFVRIYQSAGGGHPQRPNLMWVGQLELFKD